MIERWWDNCKQPEAMLWSLRGTASDRLLRLFACACCRNIWCLRDLPQIRFAVDISERFADGLVPSSALEEACAGARASSSQENWLTCWAAAEAAGGDPWQAAVSTASWAAEAEAEATARLTLQMTGSKPLASERASTAWNKARAVQCAIIRDIFGSPQPGPRVHPSWVLWKNGRVVREARAIYEAGRFRNLSRLGRLLETSGCDDSAILSHCRQAHGHVRGCWVLDLLLGKPVLPAHGGQPFRERNCCVRFAIDHARNPPSSYRPPASALLAYVA